MSRKIGHPIPDPEPVGPGGSGTETGHAGNVSGSKFEDPVASVSSSG